MSTTMTRREALYRIEECETIEEATALYVEWIGHDEHGCESLEDVVEILVGYIDEACLTDSVRSRGPHDDDDTGIQT